MDNQHYKSYEQAALDILRGNKPEEEKPVQKEQQEQDIPQPLSEAEVHPDALHVKPVKMGGQTKYKVHAVGKNFSSGIKPGEHLSDSELDDFSEMGGRIKHMKEQVKPEVEKAFPATGVKKNPPMKGVSTMPKDKERRGPMPAGSMKEDAEELDEVIRNDPLLMKVGPIRSRDNTTGRSSPEEQQQGKENVKRAVKASIARMKTDRKPRLPEEVEEDYDQLIQENNSFELELPEQLTFADYLNAAKLFTESYEDAVVVADYFFTRNDESLVVEAFTRSDIEDKVKMHQKAGNEASLPKYGMKDNKPYAEYTVTDKESGKKTKYIHHGTMRRVERMN